MVDVKNMAPSLNRWRWIGVIVFWILLLASFVLVRRYPWLDTAWNAGWALLLIVTAVFSIREMFRRGQQTGEYVFYKGVPRFLWWFVLDDEEYEKRTRKPQN